MRRTIGKHLPVDKPRGDYESKCDICGVHYFRSELRRNEGGRLFCPSGCVKFDPAKQLRRNADGALQYIDDQLDLAESVYDDAPFVYTETGHDE